MPPVVNYLAKLKVRKVTRLPAEPETLAELLARIDRPCRAAEIRFESWWWFLRRERPTMRFLGNFFSVDCEKVVRLFWMDYETKQCFGLRLTDAEQLEFAKRFEVQTLLRALGYKPATFVLEDLAAGEGFQDQFERACQVCGKQPELGPKIAVWVHLDGGIAQRLLLDCGTVVSVPDEVQARRIARRAAERKRRAEQVRA